MNNYEVVYSSVMNGWSGSVYNSYTKRISLTPQLSKYHTTTELFDYALQNVNYIITRIDEVLSMVSMRGNRFIYNGQTITLSPEYNVFTLRSNIIPMCTKYKYFLIRRLGVKGVKLDSVIRYVWKYFEQIDNLLDQHIADINLLNYIKDALKSYFETRYIEEAIYGCLLYAVYVDIGRTCETLSDYRDKCISTTIAIDNVFGSSFKQQID